MKYQLLFLTLLALVLGMDSFDSNHSQAKPAPVFQPIIPFTNSSTVVPIWVIYGNNSQCRYLNKIRVPPLTPRSYSNR